MLLESNNAQKLTVYLQSYKNKKQQQQKTNSMHTNSFMTSLSRVQSCSYGFMKTNLIPDEFKCSPEVLEKT